MNKKSNIISLLLGIALSIPLIFICFQEQHRYKVDVIEPESYGNYNYQTEKEIVVAELKEVPTIAVMETEPKTETEPQTEIETETEIATECETDYSQRIYLTEYEWYLMSRVVMSEAGGESFECQLAVAETILNRYWSDKFPNDIEEVIRQNSQYSMAYNGEPTDSVMEAVQTACEVQTFPLNMFYFRDWYYHSFGTPYISIDDMYFSLGKE